MNRTSRSSRPRWGHRRPLAALLALILCAGTATTLAVAPEAAAGGVAVSGSSSTEQVLLRAGTDGYGCFRIPTLVRTKAGSLLAIAEARKSPSCGDRGDIDLVVRRSTDSGRTWGPINVVLSGTADDPNAPYTRGNAAPVVDQVTGKIFLISTSNEQTPTGHRLPWVQQSSDDGKTWSAPVALSGLENSSTSWYATGPAHGIQLAGGKPGRLVVGVAGTTHNVTRTKTCSDGTTQSATGTMPFAGVLYSDDDGASWQSSVHQQDTYAGLDPGEVSVAELAGGSVLASARNSQPPTDPAAQNLLCGETASGAPASHRAQSISTDSGTTVPAFSQVPSLTTPDCQGSVLTLRDTYQSTPGDTLVFSGPSTYSSRTSLQIRYSVNGGASWQVPSGGTISSGPAGYSDINELSDGEIGVVYEAGAATDELGYPGWSADEIRFNRFTPTQIGLPGRFTGAVSTQSSVAAAATTPDVSSEANDAYLKGNATLGSGQPGQALTLGGNGSYADVPYSSTIDPGAGDVTYTARFKYTASPSSPDQALLWAYGFGSGKPQVWLRAQPSQDRLYAWMQGTGGGTQVLLTDGSASTAFGDGAWHDLSLVRSGSQVTLTVDGTVTGSATGVAGSLTDLPVNGVNGLRIGAEQDSAASESFNGSIDEFRLYRRALSADELSQVRADALTSDPALGLRLPFEVIDGATAPTRSRVSISDDVSGHCAAATLLGGRNLDTGRVGDHAMLVDSAHPGAQVPFLPALDLGSGDFTFTEWFRYSATSSSPDQVLMWAFGSTSGKRSLWVRAQPANDRLYGWVQTDTGQVAVALTDTGSAVAFGDNNWHLLVLTRSGGQVQLSVGGGTPATATGLTGSVSAGQADAIEGLRIGSKPDGTGVLTGDLDEMRVYGRAFTSTETAAAATGAYPSDNPALDWTFDNGYTQDHDMVLPSPASGPATPDSSVHCEHAYVRGGAAVTTDGKFGGALSLDGVSGYAEVPYGPSVALGSGDFTISTWMRYTATSTSPDQVLWWGYGTGPATRQIWLRARPSQDRLYAMMETDTATTAVAAPDPSSAVAFGDGAWHHVTLERANGSLSLIVDGVTAGSASAPAGSVTYGDAFAVDGFLLGIKPGGADPLKGSLEEFRIFRRALTSSELDAVRLNNADLGTVTAVRLPFNSVSVSPFARM